MGYAAGSPAKEKRPLEACLIYATYGRPETLSQTYQAIGRQTVRPNSVIVSCVRQGDAGTLVGRDEVRVVIGDKGSCRQRNLGLSVIPATTDVVVFFDDDFVPHPDYLAEIERVHLADPGVAMTTGRVLLDGILGPGLSFEDAAAALERAPDPGKAAGPTHREVYNGYGCNMSVDLRLARRHGVRFDEGLPLYAWWEDVDFSRRLAGHGRIVRVEAARGIHLGMKSGRQSGVRLGYSQIANPIYLLRKGTCEPERVAGQILRNVLANFGKALRPETYVDRRGRVRGNLRAFADLIRGRLSPARILDL